MENFNDCDEEIMLETKEIEEMPDTMKGNFRWSMSWPSPSIGEAGEDGSVAAYSEGNRHPT